MAITRKRETTITQLRNAIATSDTGTTTTQTWVGPYDLLFIKQTSEKSNCKSTNLVPGDADTGTLTLVYETEPPSKTEEQDTPTIEVEWVELRKKLEENAHFSGLSATDFANARKWADDPDNYTGPSFGEGTALSKFATLLAKGVTEFSIAVPVVRKTTNSATSLTTGGAWFRSTPNPTVPGWEFLKTADRVSKQGKKYQRTEEWTGAKSWDTDLYPST
jgi:hypothetical protein